jgi:putative N-acetyltransferase (TIGR04045 family)
VEANPQRTKPLTVRVAESEADLAAHYLVRHSVFVEEQRIFHDTDQDEWDATAIHLVAEMGPLIVGAVRLYPLDEAGLWQGDRLAVLSDQRRNLRAGGPLVRAAVAEAGRRGGHTMIASIQEPNVTFFQHLGWHRIGLMAPLHGLSHQRMAIRLSGAAAAFDEHDYSWALGS